MIRFNQSSMLSAQMSGLPNCEAPKTISFWATPLALSGTQGYLNATNKTSAGYQLGIRGGNWCLWNYGGVILIQTAATATETFVVYQFDGTTHGIYLNNVLAASGTGATQSGTPTACEVGNNTWAEAAAADIDDIRIYNRVLSAQERSEMYVQRGRDSIVHGCVLRLRPTGGQQAIDEARGVLFSAAGAPYAAPVNTTLAFGRQNYNGRV